MHRIAPIIGFSGHLALQTLVGGGSAISAEAGVVRDAATKVAKSTEQSVALFGEKSGALSQLAALASECAQSGWDGDDAVGISPVAIHTARQFVRALPDGFPAPEFAPEPDGSVSIDWIQSRTRMFSLSIGSNDRLAYAWLDGTDKGHAVARFDGQNIPPRVLSILESIAGRNVSLWAA